MKLIQIHPDSAFLTFPQMSVHRNDNEIYFGLGGTTQFQFNSLNCYTAMECYAYVVSCLGDPDLQSCDLPYREGMYAACWKDAATVAPLMLALPVTQQQGKPPALLPRPWAKLVLVLVLLPVLLVIRYKV